MMDRWTIFVGLFVMVCLAGCRHLPDAAMSQGKTKVVEEAIEEPGEDISIYHSLVNFVLKEDLIGKDGKARYSDPVLLLLPYKFRPGYVPDVQGIKVVVGERSDMGNFKTVVTVRNVKQTDYGFSIEVVHNPHISMGASGSNYFLEKTTNGWRQAIPKGNERPFCWKS